MDMNDLISAGMIGLVDAMEKYEESRRVLFRTYAEFRIRGAMLDEIRSMDWVPRAIRDKTNLLKRTLSEMEKKFGRSPSEDEMAEGLSMEIKEYRDFLAEAQEATLVSLDDTESGLIGESTVGEARKPFHPLDGHDALETLLSEDTKRILSKAIETLPARERTIISLYYFNELTMKEIGKVLEITESRVSQLHHHALTLLKVTLRELT
jgi:RNA polymerase sigma factor for flagellar operon FliA